MPTVHKSALLFHSSQQLYDLVCDVPAYKEFLPWCGDSVVQESSATHMLATITIDFRGIRQSFTTANEMHAPHRVSMALRDGPFSRLDGVWHFMSLRHDACKVEFKLDYLFKSGLLGQALVPVFDQIARSMVDAFARRADEIYGAGSSNVPFDRDGG
jgi:ribosome-associated toxin RatA of RatAB toxin-antitoxin module